MQAVTQNARHIGDKQDPQKIVAQLGRKFHNHQENDRQGSHKLQQKRMVQKLLHNASKKGVKQLQNRYHNTCFSAFY